MDLLQKLKNLRRKWRREVNRERKFQQELANKNKHYCPALEKSVGIDIGYSMCANDLDKIIRAMEQEDLQDFIQRLEKRAKNVQPSEDERGTSEEDS